MIFDKQEHKNIVMQMINETRFMGDVLEIAAELKAAVMGASILTHDIPPMAAKEDIPAQER